MAIIETEALVLRTYNFAEADKIVVSLTQASGLIRGVAKGCRKLKSRFGAALEPFTLIKLVYYEKENQELVSLRNADIVQSHFDLSSQAEMLAGLAYMGDLIIEFSPPHEANDNLFRMVKACLDAVSNSPTDLQMALRYFEIWLLKLQGFLPDVRRCGECHSEFANAREAFLNSDLVLRCRSCGHGQGRVLSRSLQSQLQATQKLSPQKFLQASHEVSDNVHREFAELTHQLIGRALERQPRLRSTFQ
ncbi:MAG TPA: DNA repair protein RecO [Pyrinomonadaceae bacterium]|nr:DNA repair protein RecO [Pyrinomonadaceae bacterium]